MIAIGTDNIADDFRLTFLAGFNFGLEDDRVAGLDGADRIVTGAGNDYIDAGPGGDELSGCDGNDTILAGDGNDFVKADLGNDIYHGGAGIDTLDFRGIGRGVLNDAGEPNLIGVKVNLAVTGPQDLGPFGIDQFDGFEDIFGGLGNDTLSGSSDANLLNGDLGNDILNGCAGNDTLQGDLGADTLIGGTGTDLIDCGDIVAVPGTDDQASDIVRYKALNESGAPEVEQTWDTIREFVPGQDKIDLSAIDANLARRGNQAFKVVTKFTKAFGEVHLVYDEVAGNTLVEIDGDRDSAVDMRIFVKGAHLTLTDFIL